MSEFSTLFGPHGPLAGALSGFRSRTSQQRMADRIAEALEQRELLLVEAGTGTGKTFAYLVPALLSGRRVLISTGTRTLQDQLFHRDLPLLAAALGRPARVSLLKGRGNYLCRSRLESLERQSELLPAGSNSLLARIDEWARATRFGDLAELPELGESHPLRPQITSTRENCLGTRCPHLSRCAVLDARREAIESDIVVVNHHLLLADLALKEDGFGDLLPSVEAVILDEAHQLPDLVSEFFGTSLSSRQLELFVADLRAELRETAVAEDATRGWVAPLERSLAGCLAAFGRQERLLPWTDRPASAASALEDLSDALADCAEGLSQLAPGPGIEQCAERVRALSADLTSLLDESGDSAAEGARTVAVSPRGFLLRLLPYDISARFCTLLRTHPGAWVFTSATLAVGEDFTHFASRLGLSSAATARFESPFDYARQALLYLPPDMPEPGNAGFTAAVVGAARPLLAAAAGGAFLLFTSHRALRAAAELLRSSLPPELPLLVQGEAPREQLLRRFRASGRAVLLGTASVWEGVDVQGDALRLVIIDKLPFNSPDDPVVRARVEHLESQGIGAFRHYQLPEAVLALKQGVGRLIRSETDRGVVVLCDPRLQSRSYGRVFLSSLPPMRRVTDVVPVLALLRELAAAPGLPAAVPA